MAVPDFSWASQPFWQGHWTTPVGQTFTPASQLKTPRRLYQEAYIKRQNHLTLGYFLVQYHFALHPPFNMWEQKLKGMNKFKVGDDIKKETKKNVQNFNFKI